MSEKLKGLFGGLKKKVSDSLEVKKEEVVAPPAPTPVPAPQIQTVALAAPIVTPPPVDPKVQQENKIINGDADTMICYVLGTTHTPKEAAVLSTLLDSPTFQKWLKNHSS